MSVQVRLGNAKLAAEKPLQELKIAQELYDKAVETTRRVQEVAHRIGVKSFYVFSGELNVLSDNRMCDVLARESGVFVHQIDLRRCYVGQYTLLDGAFEAKEEE